MNQKKRKHKKFLRNFHLGTLEVIDADVMTKINDSKTFPLSSPNIH
jgi:hypothetical protein